MTGGRAGASARDKALRFTPFYAALIPLLLYWLPMQKKKDKYVETVPELHPLVPKATISLFPNTQVKRPPIAVYTCLYVHFNYCRLFALT